MRFVIAPDWLMKLPDDYVLNKKHVYEIYCHTSHRSIQNLLSTDTIPKPDVIIPIGKCTRLGWTVRHIKNNTKLPEEIIQISID